MAGATSGLIEGVNTAEAVVKHFQNTLLYIQGRKEGAQHTEGENNAAAAGGGGGEAWKDQVTLFEGVDVAGPLLKLQGL